MIFLNQSEAQKFNLDHAAFVGNSNEVVAETTGFNFPSIELRRQWDLILQIEHLMTLGNDIIIVNK